MLNVSASIAAPGWFIVHGDILPVPGLATAAPNMTGSPVGTRFALRGGSALIGRVFTPVVVALIIRIRHDASLALRHD